LLAPSFESSFRVAEYATIQGEKDKIESDFLNQRLHRHKVLGFVRLCIALCS